MHTMNMRRGSGYKVLRFLAGCLAAVLTLLLLTPARPQFAGSEDTAKLIAEAMASQENNQAMLDDIYGQMDQLEGSVSEYSGELAWLNEKNEEQKEQYRVLLEEKEAALKAVDEAITAYLQAEEELAQKEAEYQERLQVMFEHRDKPLLEVFLESGNLQGFFTNLEIIKAVAEYDDQMLDDLEAARIEAEIKREDSLKKQADAEALVQIKEAELDELQGEISRSSEQLEAAQQQLALSEAAEEELLAQSKEFEKSIYDLQVKFAQEKKAEEEAARLRNTGLVYYGDLAWPVPASTWITSPFQPYGRTDLPGLTRPHMGVDIGAPFNTPVIAARGGYVLMVYNPEWQGWYTGGFGYGNYVVIDHGGGLATLYAHLRQYNVSVGQSVSAGDVIGLVGSTGNSTGPHLHFEVRVNGTPVNPIQDQYIGHP